MMLSNYHTHTHFCDGADSPKELVEKAIELRCPEIGFSGHSYTPFDPGYCMNPEIIPIYVDAIQRLQEEYADEIVIRLGLEQDITSAPVKGPFSYCIGSVHYVERNGVYLSVDESLDQLQRGVEEWYGGDYYRLAQAYYALVGKIYEVTGCQIVGHFDLLTKFNEGGQLFDENHPLYREAVLSALDRLCQRPVAFELNTGGMARGYCSTPYPNEWICEEIRRRGKPLIFSSDCHRKEQLLFGAEQWAGICEPMQWN